MGGIGKCIGTVVVKVLGTGSKSLFAVFLCFQHA